MNNKILSKRQLRRKIASNTKKTLTTLLSHSGERSHFSGNSEYSKLNNILLNTEDYNNHLSVDSIQDTTSTVPTSESNFNNFNFNSTLIENNDIVSNDTVFSETSIKTQTNNNISTWDSKSEQVFLKKIRKWAIGNNVTHKAVNELLHILKEQYHFLPKDARTILGTPRSIESESLDNGELVYLGLEKQLLKKIREGLVDDNNVINLQVNIDGIPIFECSTLSFWPILVRSNNFKNKSPFAVAIFCGTEKPQPLDNFVNKFIEEVLYLKDNCLCYKEKVYKTEISLFTCDAPARAFLKNIVGHTSKIGCERCTIRANREENRTYYPVRFSANARIDQHFLNESNRDNHIKGKSPLLRLDVGLVSQFALDPMHLIYLGVTKRLLVHYWIEGKRPHKLSNISIKRINFQINSLKTYVPSEFNRKLRSFVVIKKWKAVEFRFFLLYCGPFLMKTILDKEKYEHFLLLHAAIFIFSNQDLIEKYFNLAKEFIDKFVNTCPDFYDKFFITYNVHSLCHMWSDVQRFGCIESYSCFSFESYLGQLKRKIRGKNRPLKQISKRLQELEDTYTNAAQTSKCIIPKGIISECNTYIQYKKLQLHNFTISIDKPNNIVFVQKKLCTIKYILYKNNRYQCVGTVFKYLKDFYSSPLHSSDLGIYFARGAGEQITFDVDEISYKCIGFPYKDGFYITPILHQKF